MDTSDSPNLEPLAVPPPCASPSLDRNFTPEEPSVHIVERQIIVKPMRTRRYLGHFLHGMDATRGSLSQEMTALMDSDEETTVEPIDVDRFGVETPLAWM